MRLQGSQTRLGGDVSRVKRESAGRDQEDWKSVGRQTKSVHVEGGCSRNVTQTLTTQALWRPLTLSRVDDDGHARPQRSRWRRVIAQQARRAWPRALWGLVLR